MADLFLEVVNRSIAASWLILAVLALRLLLKQAPKWVRVLLWGIVAVRLLCPFSIESGLSLIPSSEIISPAIMYDPTPEVSTGIQSVNSLVNPVITGVFSPDPAASVNPLQIWIPAASVAWCAGMALLLLYTAVSCWRLRRRVSTAVRLRENIYRSEFVESPFVLGIIWPRIYLPFKLDGTHLDHVIAHEQTHIRRKDHWWKPLGFLLLTIHWFNPFAWAAYILLCRDIELACDARVIRSLGVDARADYSQALLSGSVKRSRIAQCPLAFGEVGVKERVKNVLNYQEPAFWVVVIAVVLCVAVAVCFLSDPLANPEKLPTLEQTYMAISQKGEDFDVGLIGQHRDSLITYWGEPDGMLSGFWGDIWKLEGLANVIVYYDSDGIIAHVKVVHLEDDPVYSSTDADQNTKYQLTIGRTGVYSIEITTPFSGGGCSHADETPFAYGEKVWLDHLDGLTNLRGVIITALDADGNQMFSVSIPEYEGAEPINVVTCGQWRIAPAE